jgi:uncharacterized protein (TIGR00255 family)
MIKSMTGFGKELLELPDQQIMVEIRTLNSKQTDINLKTPSLFREKEPEIRNLIREILVRGKIELTITYLRTGDQGKYRINKTLASKYYKEIKSFVQDMGETDFSEIIPVILRMPEVMIAEEDVLDEKLWTELKRSIKKAIEKVNSFRVDEGTVLEIDMIQHITLIKSLLERVKAFEEERINLLREKILKNIEVLSEKINWDRNRFEQELIYYIEKMDITEEKVRLHKHCDYFLETLTMNEPVGRKLSFIAQEMGREINTIGSKANDENIQKLVVQMKDELEKIKEQLYNIL